MLKPIYEKLLDCHRQNIDTYNQSAMLQSSMWHRETVSKVPLLLYSAANDFTGNLTVYNHKNRFDSPMAMLESELGNTANLLIDGSNAIPSVRANMGCGVFPTLLGVKQNRYEDKMPWVTEHLTKETLSSITKITISDEFKQGLEYMAFMHEQLKDSGVLIYPMDLQGAYDMAHIILGNSIFYDMYDDEEFVHYLLELCCEAMFVGMKEIGKYMPAHYIPHYNGVVMPSDIGGVKISEDTSTLLSDEQICQFVMPYMKKILDHFGGGYIHYCGKNPHLLRHIMEVDNVYGINFGNTDMHDMINVLKGCSSKGKIYQGNIVKPANATYEEFYTDIVSASKNKDGIIHLLLTQIVPNADILEVQNAWNFATKI